MNVRVEVDPPRREIGAAGGRRLYRVGRDAELAEAGVDGDGFRAAEDATNALNSVSHPTLAPCEIDRSGDGEFVVRLPDTDGFSFVSDQFPRSAVPQVFIQTLDLLATLEEAGVAHGDLSVASLLVHECGVIRWVPPRTSACSASGDHDDDLRAAAILYLALAQIPRPSSVEEWHEIARKHQLARSWVLLLTAMGVTGDPVWVDAATSLRLARAIAHVIRVYGDSIRLSISDGRIVDKEVDELFAVRTVVGIQNDVDLSIGIEDYIIDGEANWEALIELADRLEDVLRWRVLPED